MKKDRIFKKSKRIGKMLFAVGKETARITGVTIKEGGKVLAGTDKAMGKIIGNEEPTKKRKDPFEDVIG